MKLECNFHYMKELFNINGIHIYECSVHRYGYLSAVPLILYMVCKANKDGFAADKDIKRGFYTLKQALNYAIVKYNFPIEYANKEGFTNGKIHIDGSI